MQGPYIYEYSSFTIRHTSTWKLPLHKEKHNNKLNDWLMTATPCHGARTGTEWMRGSRPRQVLCTSTSFLIYVNHRDSHGARCATRKNKHQINITQSLSRKAIVCVRAHRISNWNEWHAIVHRAYRVTILQINSTHVKLHREPHSYVQADVRRHAHHDQTCTKRNSSHSSEFVPFWLDWIGLIRYVLWSPGVCVSVPAT